MKYKRTLKEAELTQVWQFEGVKCVTFWQVFITGQEIVNSSYVRMNLPGDGCIDWKIMTYEYIPSY